MDKIKLMAFDLDGTLLTTDKRLSERNEKALYAAAEKGILIVPSTGRYYGTIPEIIRNLECVRYCLTINGAYVLDRKTDECMYRADMSVETALQIMRYLDTLPVCYDCYLDNKGWMTKELQDKACLYADGFYLETLRSWRTPVPDIKEFIKEQQKPVQKIQFFMRDLEAKERAAEELRRMFPNTAVSSSVRNNVEINDAHANKGEALLSLAKKLGIKREEIMAFGDGGNDFDMIRAAGVGVVMENGRDDLKKLADIIAPHCDEDGVAQVIEKVLAE